MQATLSPKEIKQTTRRTQVLGAYTRDNKLFVMFPAGEYVFSLSYFESGELSMRDGLLYIRDTCINGVIFNLIDGGYYENCSSSN